MRSGGLLSIAGFYAVSRTEPHGAHFPIPFIVPENSGSLPKTASDFSSCTSIPAAVPFTRDGKINGSAAGVVAMAFLKLFLFEGQDWLPMNEVLERMRTEFRFVDVDSAGGQDHVDDIIAATLRFSDALPHKQAQLADLQSVRESAVYVSFRDSDYIEASCCLMKDQGLFFDNPDEIDGPARPLVERLAGALNYELYES